MPVHFRNIALIPVIVEPGECQISTDANHRLVSREIRSSLVLAVYVPSLHLGGLVRFSHPDAAGDSIATLLSRIRDAGGIEDELRLYAAGGATVPENPESAACGKANVLALKKALWREGVCLTGEDLGGDFTRSLALEPTTGRVIVRSEKERGHACGRRLAYAV